MAIFVPDRQFLTDWQKLPDDSGGFIDMQQANTYTDITLTDLETLRQQPNTLLVDVRDEWEFEEFNIGGTNIPLPDIRKRKAELTDFDAILVICTNGVRSRIAAKDMLRQPELTNKIIYHLEGGILETE